MASAISDQEVLTSARELMEQGAEFQATERALADWFELVYQIGWGVLPDGRYVAQCRGFPVGEWMTFHEMIVKLANLVSKSGEQFRQYFDSLTEKRLNG